MNKLFYLFVLIVPLSMFIPQGIAMNMDCSQSGSVNISSIYGNIYHSGVSDSIAQNIYEGCYSQDQYYKFLGQVTGSSIVSDSGTISSNLYIIPVYNPKQNLPVLVIRVIEQNDFKELSMISHPIKVLLTNKEDCKFPRLDYMSLNISCFTKPYINPDRKNIVSLIKHSPYTTAYSLQFYIYRLKILLVARDKTGEVTSFLYENSKVTPTQQEIQKYLGDKWYHP